MKNFRRIMAIGMLAGAVCARQPDPPRVTLTSAFPPGVAPQLTIQNGEQVTVSVRVQPGPHATVRFAAIEQALPAGATAYLTLSDAVIGQGRQTFHVEGEVTTPAGPVATKVSLFEPLRVGKTGIEKISFDEAFLSVRIPAPAPSDVAEYDYGQGYVERSEAISPVFAALRLPPGTAVEAQPLADMADLLKLKPGTLPPDGQAVVTDIKAALEPQFLAVKGAAERADAAYNVTGRFAMRYSDGGYAAAWGLTVRVWINIGGRLMPLGTTLVNSAGFWTIQAGPTVLMHLGGAPLYIQYLSQNRFVKFVDPSNRVYGWAEELRGVPLFSTGTFDTGAAYADLTEVSGLPGLYPLLTGSSYLWDKLTAFGISPLRDDPYRVTYPNSRTSGPCPAWSCSGTDGNIVLIPEHANRTTIQHELGHSINRRFWGGMPGDAGGSHGLTGCYTRGVGMTEGFGDFLPFWTQNYPDTALPVSEFRYNIESPGAGYCPGETNEVWVSATFWDLYDRHDDYRDRLSGDRVWYGQGDTIATYLRNRRDSMSEYLPVLQRLARTPEDLTALFRWNTMVP